MFKKRRRHPAACKFRVIDLDLLIIFNSQGAKMHPDSSILTKSHKKHITYEQKKQQTKDVGKPIAKCQFATLFVFSIGRSHEGRSQWNSRVRRTIAPTCYILAWPVNILRREC